MTRTVSSRDVAIVTLLAVAAVFVLLPIASTGFLGDDQFNSSVNGLLETSKRSFAEFAWTTTLSFFHETARFVPGASFIAYGIFHFVPNLLAYKCLQVAALAADLVLFAVLLRMLGAGTAFIALAGVIALASVQFHGHYDGYLGFAMTEEILLAVTLGSWICFAAWLRGGARWLLLLAVALYVAGVLSYETCYPFSLGHLAIAIRLQGRSAWRTALPFLSVTGAAFIMLAVARALFPQPETAVYHFRLVPADIARTLFDQLADSLPLTYLVFHEHAASVLYPAFWSVVPVWLVAALALGAFALGYLALSQAGDKPRDLRSLAVVGLVLWVLPPVLIAPIPRYQQEVSLGFGYILMVIGGFGAAIVLACVIAKAASMLPARAKQPFALTGSVVLAAVLVLTFATNERTVADYEAERAAQLNVAAAFDDGIADGVPQEAELWADAPAQIFRRADEMRLGNGGLADARFFVAEHGRRTLRVRATWQQPPPMECAAASCAVPSAVYAVRDVPLGIRDGYTVLGHVRRVAIGSDHLARPFVDDLRLHVRGAGLANLAASAARPGLALRLACTGRPALRTVAVDVAPADVARGIVLRLPAPCLVDLEYVSLVRRPGAS